MTIAPPSPAEKGCNVGWCLCAALTTSLAFSYRLHAGDVAPVISPIRELRAQTAGDQDDMCVWVHPQDRSHSTVIVSDKEAGRLFVYDLSGRLLQELLAQKPGNIDIRSGFPLAGSPVDIVVVNQREGADGFKLLVYKVNRQTRLLERVDDDIRTGDNYGGCLFHNRKAGRFYFVCTSESGTVEQYQLDGSDIGKVTGKKVRSWPLGKCEGAVADDETGRIFISEESRGIWKLGGEPEDPAPGKLILKIGDHGLEGDLEGLAIGRRGDGNDFLIVSDQGRSRFVLFELAGEHRLLGEFSIAGARDTDGIELVLGDLGPSFPGGLFACHTARLERGVLLTAWRDIAAALPSVGQR
jgi:3-phytase